MIVTFKKSVKNLFTFWAVISFVLLLLFSLQSLNGKYEPNSGSAWHWVLLNVIAPTLLIFLVLLYVLNKNRMLLTFQLPRFEENLFLLLVVLSSVYLLAILAIPLLAPFVDNSGKNEVEILQQNDVALHILQAALLAIVILFVYRINNLYQKKSSVGQTQQEDGSLTVFMSYNHGNSDSAEKLKGFLEKEDIKVIMDSAKMLAGEPIMEFIQHSIEKSQVTFSVVSKESLVSGWVAIETLSTFRQENFTKKTRFIAGYVDQDFFKTGFIPEAIKQIDVRLTEIKQEQKDCQNLDTESSDTDDDEERLLYLRENLALIIKRLRSCLCVDIADSRLPAAIPLILKSIKQL